MPPLPSLPPPPLRALLLLLLLVGLVWSAWLPGTTSRLPNNNLVISAGIPVGSIVTGRKLVLDYSQTSAFVKFETQSSTTALALPDGNVTDVYRIAGKVVALKTVYAPNLNSPLLCNDCVGVLGLGAGSPLWLLFRTAAFSARGITFNTPTLASGIDCGVDALCLAPMAVTVREHDGSVAFSGTVDVRLAAAQPTTVLPAAVYKAVRSTRNPAITPSNEWPTLELAAAGSKFTMAPAQYLLSRFGDGAATFSFEKSTGSEIVLGQNAFLSMAFERDWFSGKGRYIDVAINPQYDGYAIVFMMVLIVLWGIGHRAPIFFMSPSLVHIGSRITIVVVELTALIAAPLTFADARTRAVLFARPFFGVMLSIIVGYHVLAVLGGQIHDLLFRHPLLARGIHDRMRLWVLMRETVRGNALLIAVLIFATQTTADRWFTPLALVVSAEIGNSYARGVSQTLSFGLRNVFDAPFLLWTCVNTLVGAGLIALLFVQVYLPSLKWVVPFGGATYYFAAVFFFVIAFAFFFYIARADISRIWGWIAANVRWRLPLRGRRGAK